MLRLLIEGDPVGAVLAAAKLELRVLDLGVGAPPLVGVLGRRGGSAKLRRARGVSDSLT